MNTIEKGIKVLNDHIGRVEYEYIEHLTDDHSYIKILHLKKAIVLREWVGKDHYADNYGMIQEYLLVFGLMAIKDDARL